MPFSEALKLDVKRRADFRCCLCHALGIEIHHIIPQEVGGPDVEVNAAPLCPSCHEAYGANPTKRKFIREARDVWYEIVPRRFESEAGQLDRLASLVGRAATKEDLAGAVSQILGMLGERGAQPF